MAANYTEDDIKSLDWREHIRMRPGMYIGKLGDGSSPDDGLYILLKEAIDNSIDEHIMGYGKEIKGGDRRGRPRRSPRLRPRHSARKLFDCAAQINTGAKYDSEAFKKIRRPQRRRHQGGQRALRLFRDPGMARGRDQGARVLQGPAHGGHEAPAPDDGPTAPAWPSRSTARFSPAKAKFKEPFVEKMCRYYSYLNPALTVVFNGKKFRSKDGLLDLLREEMENEALYPPIHLGRQGHRDRLHPHRRKQRGILYLRQRPEHLAGRHPPRRLPRGAGPGLPRVLQKTIRARRHPGRHRGGDLRADRRAGLRIPDQDQARLHHHRTGMASRCAPSSAISSNRISTTTCTRTRRSPRPSRSASRPPNASARISRASRNSPANAPNRPRSTTRNCATAASTSTPNTSAARNPRSSSPRATPPPARSPKAAMSKPRRCSRCAANRSTPSACPQDRL
jgi:hypothetical protein